MGRWTDIAEWRGPTPNHSGPMVEQRGVVEHIAQGSYEGTIGWCKNPDSGVSCHFVVARDGRIAQVADTDITVWTQIQGNGHWISVENEGFIAQGGLTAAQINSNATIFAKAHAVYGVPLQLASSPSGRGLGHHSMGAENGVNWGHSECPGSAIKAQKPAILARAIEIAAGAPPERINVMGAIVRWPASEPGKLYFSNGDAMHHIPGVTELNQIQAGFPGIPTVDATAWVDKLVHKLYGHEGEAWGTPPEDIPLPGEEEIAAIARDVARAEIAGATLTPDSTPDA
jgi:hypothetical protein